MQDLQSARGRWRLAGSGQLSSWRTRRKSWESWDWSIFEFDPGNDAYWYTLRIIFRSRLV